MTWRISRAPSGASSTAVGTPERLSALSAIEAAWPYAGLRKGSCDKTQ
jgi:hypothetical protein